RRRARRLHQCGIQEPRPGGGGAGAVGDRRSRAVRRLPRWPLLLLPLVALGLALFVFDFPRSGSDEMAPTLRKGDLLLACRLCGGPDRGDVVVFANPDRKGDLSLRRIVGAPGDRVEVRRGAVWVNGIPLVDEPLPPLTLPGLGTFDAVGETVGAHQFRAIRDPGVRSTSN